MSKKQTSRVSLKKYTDDFLDRADPLRWAVEPLVCLEEGEQRFRVNGQKRVWRVNTAVDIHRGYKIVQYRDEDDTVALDRFHYSKESRQRREQREREGRGRSKYGRFKYHVCRKARPGPKKQGHYWLFTTYEEDQPVGFIQFEFDLHLSRGPSKHEKEMAEQLGVEPDLSKSGLTPEEKDEQRAIFRRQVNTFLEVAEHLGFADSICWTTSPGDIFDGKWEQGLYAWIPLQQYVPVCRLRELSKQFKAHYGLQDVECSWDSRARHIRFAGQRYVELCDPHTQEVLHPVEKRSSEALAAFAQAWNHATPVSQEVIFGESIEQQQEKAPSPKATKTRKPRSLEAHRPYRPRPLTMSQRGGWLVPSIEESQVEGNTFKAAIDARLFARQAWRYRGNLDHLDQAVQDIKDEFIQRRPGCSITAANPLPFLNRVMRWHFLHFDPSKAKHQGRRQRDGEDHQRIAYCLGLDQPDLLRACDHRTLRYREKVILSAFYSLMDRYHGRVAAKRIYSESDSICSKAEWFRLLSKLKGILTVVDEHDVEDHKCRQWALSRAFINQVKERQKIRGGVQEIIRRGEKSVKCVYGTSHDVSEVLTPHSLDNDDRRLQNEESAMVDALLMEPAMSQQPGWCALT